MNPDKDDIKPNGPAIDFRKTARGSIHPTINGQDIAEVVACNIRTSMEGADVMTITVFLKPSRLGQVV